MKNFFTLLFVGIITTGALAQYPLVQVHEINHKSQVDLANCDDESDYFMDTVTVVGYVVTDGGLSEVYSSSINGANGTRPFIFLNDTANNGEVGPWTGLEVMGVNWGTSQATAGFTSLIEGDLVEITGVVGGYQGATQFQPLNDNALDIKSGSMPSFTPAPISVGDLNDQNQVNQLETGEQWEGAFVEVNNVQVVTVDQWGSGTNARVNFTVADAGGNTMQVYDFFVAQRLPSWSTLNPNSPFTNGNFTAPSVGTFFTSLKGVIEHSGNGCTGFGGQGYRMHPFDSSHYEIGEAYPAFMTVDVAPAIPSSSDSITIEAEVVDQDGNIDSVHLFWASDTTLPTSAFNQELMALGSGSNYTFTIPPQPDRTVLNYYIRAVDDSGNVSFYPTTISGQAQNLERIFVVDGNLSIMDIQTPLSGGGDASPFEGYEVTVEGVVTSISNPNSCGLGYVYIQDTTANEYAGLGLRSSLNLNGLARNEYVRVTGTIEESFGFTQMAVSNITSLGKGPEVGPVVLDPADAAELNEYEKYESMLVTYRAQNNGKLHVVVPDIAAVDGQSRGEYAISSTQNPASSAHQRRILAGRQSSTYAQSSLYVQLVSDTSVASYDGSMFHQPIAVDTSITMDAVTGILWYSFGNYKLTPRTNFDFENPSVQLDTTGCEIPFVSVEEVEDLGKVEIYPNPTSHFFTVEGPGKEINVTLYDLKGSALAHEQSLRTGTLTIDARNLKPGIYLLKVTGANDTALGSYKLVVGN